MGRTLLRNVRATTDVLIERKETFIIGDSFMVVLFVINCIKRNLACSASSKEDADEPFT